jgi:hypothetical protein
MALLTERSDRSRALNWIQIGAMAGPTIELPSIALRAANLRLQGNGQGAVSSKATSPNCRHSSTRSTPAPSRSRRRRWPWPMSRKSGPRPIRQASERYSCHRPYAGSRPMSRTMDRTFYRSPAGAITAPPQQLAC